MAVLNFLKGANLGSTFELNHDRIVVGRNADCTVVLNVPAVSREHAVIRRIQGKFYIEDLKSRNGTFVNNKEVTTRMLLKNEDKIKICDNIFAYLEEIPRVPLPDELKANKEVEEEEHDSSTVEATLSTSSREILVAQPAEKLALLLDLGNELSQTLNVDALLPKIMESLFNVFRQADRGFIILDEDGKLVPRVIKTRRADDEDAARFSRKIVRRCMETGQAILSEDASSDAQFDLSQSIADCRIRSVMIAPLMGRGTGTALGVIQIDRQDRFQKFTQEDLKLLIAVAGQAAIALENAQMQASLIDRAGLERDLALAHRVQLSFLPKKAPILAGYEFFAHYASALEVGGDYYDFIPMPGPRLGVFIGDVAGKGVPAALLMAKVSSDARFCSLTEKSLADTVFRLNDLMQEAALLDRFVTLGTGLIDPATHEVSFVNAGHIPPLIYRRATGKLEEGMDRDLAGFPLGVAEGIPYEAVTLTLAPGDSVALFTDGVTEAKDKNDKEFQLDGAIAALSGGPMTVKAMGERLVAAIEKHSLGCKQHDDITVVCFGRTH